jgi:hypothetical protein
MNIYNIDNPSLFYAKERKIISIINDKIYDLISRDISKKYLEYEIEDDDDDLYNIKEEEDNVIDIKEIVELYNSVYTYFCDLTNKISEKMDDDNKIECKEGLIKEIETKISFDNNVLEMVSIIVDGIDNLITKIKELESISKIDIYTFEETIRRVKDKINLSK